MKAERFILLGALVSLAMAFGCGNKGEGDTKKADPKGPVVIKDEDLITAIDYEEAAEKSIDMSNYKTELTTLEATIAKP
jgi:hypothetical protein